MKGKKVLVRFTKECYKHIGETDYITIRQAEAWAGIMHICEVIDPDIQIIIDGGGLMLIKPKEK